MASATIPALTARRSQLNRWHIERGGVIGDQSGIPFVADYGDIAGEAAAAVRLGVCDLSLLWRSGVTGPGSIDVLDDAGLQVPNKPNLSRVQGNGDLLVRLSMQEFLLLSLSVLSSNRDRPVNESHSVAVWGNAYETPRADSHCLFALSGRAGSDLMAKLCGVDLRTQRFPAGSVAQTSIARINGIVIRHDFGALENYLLLVATPAAEYLWTCLLDAMREYGGRPIGTTALRQRLAGTSGRSQRESN